MNALKIQDKQSINAQTRGMTAVEAKAFLQQRWVNMLKRTQMTERADEIDAFICSEDEFLKVFRMCETEEDLDLMATIHQFRETMRGISGRP